MAKLVRGPTNAIIASCAGVRGGSDISDMPPIMRSVIARTFPPRAIA